MASAIAASVPGRRYPLSADRYGGKILERVNEYLFDSQFPQP
jgi:hypothetical protein